MTETSPRSKPSAFICDLDGTLSDCSHRIHLLKTDYDQFERRCIFDQPRPMTLEVFRALEKIHLPIIISARPSMVLTQTEHWLEKQGIGYELLLMGRPLEMPDAHFKKHAFEQYVAGNYDVKLVLEDRQTVVDMWRSLGLEVWQVAAGNY